MFFRRAKGFFKNRKCPFQPCTSASSAGISPSLTQGSCEIPKYSRYHPVGHLNRKQVKDMHLHATTVSEYGHFRFSWENLAWFDCVKPCVISSAKALTSQRKAVFIKWRGGVAGAAGAAASIWESYWGLLQILHCLPKNWLPRGTQFLLNLPWLILTHPNPR